MARTKQTARKLSQSKKPNQADGGLKKGKHKKDKANGTSTAVAGAVRKPHRWRPGTVALREIKKYQKSVDNLIRRAPFRRLTREIAQDFKTDLKFTKNAFDCLQEATEQFMVERFRHAQKACVHGKRLMLGVKDLQFAKEMSLALTENTA